ncbi:hypothetical protein L1987_64248 [Smallanthus sonchifolius]|uniref:Uncharacterized protein n=1 Tax=Smallanthus sonchifolius TaxID=185202 RepID=A0ACB9CFJ2_9ASTR|nr:hypothetical protein L1987_64248 [Smallanthus sonchifolius]
MERLRKRENFEKDDGGFRSGELRNVYVSLNSDESEAEDDSTETVAEVKEDDGKKQSTRLDGTIYIFFPSQSSQETNEEAYELGDKSLKTADMGNDMEDQDERNNVDDAIKTSETGEESR